MNDKYIQRGFVSYRNEDGTEEIMANFVARIVKEVRHYVDNEIVETLYTITGEMPPREEGEERVALPATEVNAEQFAGMGWVSKAWGARCIIFPGTSIKDDLRTMIQIASKPEIVNVYKQTGWAKIDGQRTYLHVGGGITAKGNDPTITVQLPNELSRYNLVCAEEPAQCIYASLALLDLADKSLTWPLLAATLAPLYGECDFALHITGRTGSFKSELTSLFQSHYGAGMDARHLPCGWTSTENAIQALAFYAANALFTVDDFVPKGTAYQMKGYHSKAETVIRAQGNQAGRARLTDISSLQRTMYPRGLILSTGEDTPEGHSVRARMLIREIAPGDITAADLTRAQANRAKYPGTVAWVAQQLARAPQSLTERTNALRTELQTIGHSRTPGMLGRLIATAEAFCDLCQQAKIMTAKAGAKYKADAKAAIVKAGEEQMRFLEDMDPVDIFVTALRQVLASGGGHFRTLRGNTPNSPEVLGWTAEREIGGIQTWKARGPVLGWVKTDANELYLDEVVGFNVVKKAAGQELALSKQTLLKRVKESGLCTRTDESRGRNTVRVVAENHRRNVICLALSQALDMTQVREEDDDAEEEQVGDDDE